MSKAYKINLDVPIHGANEMVSLPELIESMFSLRNTLKEIDDFRATIQEQYDLLRRRRIPSMMEDNHIENININGIKVRIGDELFISIPSEERDNAYKWLELHGYADLITNTINSSTLKAWAKESIKEGQHIPENMFKITIMPIVKFY